MVDVISRKRMLVYGEPLTGAHLVVPFEQLQSVTDALARGGVTFWVPKEVLMFPGSPPATVVTLSRSSDKAAVQDLLDAI